MSQHFKFSSSRYLAAMLCIAHGAFLMVLPLLALPFWSRLLLAAAVLFSLGYYLWRDAWLLAADSCTGLTLQGEVVILSLRNGAQLHAEVVPGSLLTPLLMVLRLSLPASRKARSLVILPDSLGADSFRQLRVWLKWGWSGHAVAGRGKHGGFGQR
ncbi:MAG: hypothetical protein GC139_05840 [Sideroxydans sp.]|nr:hypothetical protein [Sideroxydans sp.]